MNHIIENGQSKLRKWWDTYEVLFGDDPLGRDGELGECSCSDDSGSEGGWT